MPHLPAHRVLRFDRPGLGHSPARPHVPTLHEEVERLAALIEHFTDGGAVVVAHSLAGLHAEALARRHPTAVRGLVLVDPSHVPEKGVAALGAAARFSRDTSAKLAWALAAAAEST